MDFCRNVSVPGDQYQQEQVLSSPPCSKLGALTSNPLDDLFPAHNTEVDVSLEWLSIFVEDCLSSSGIRLPAAEAANKNVQNGSTTTVTAPKSPKPLQNKPRQIIPPSLEKFVVPGKARSKRKRTSSCRTSESRSLSSWTHNFNSESHLFELTSSDPPLLQQAYWLADSELILPKKEDNTNTPNTNNNKVKANHEENTETKEESQDEVEELEKNVVEGKEVGQQQPRRCTHCLAQRTPQWRAGPLGPKTLCNACGVRYKSGRLLPEYRPAKSPTFVSYLHSNSHKKVMEMRMALMSPAPK
ncbi:GATA transcription factor [Melia azedarach]|uniref:GATA transcription factor n=1 Tax=Melia azedarach TaxID=155640 RepID=A0ACC1YE30_MELAZ|nr:GATA transcription factor [Melia azedarach]